MSDYDSLNHTKWKYKYHVVVIPKYRRKVIYGKVHRDLIKEILHEFGEATESQILEGHLCPDHVHMMIRTPLKYAVFHVVGYLHRNRRR
jgi:putative transposase